MRAGALLVSFGLFGFTTLFSLAGRAACSGASPDWITTPDFASFQQCVSGASSGDTVHVVAGSATWSGGQSVTISDSLHIDGAGSSATTIIDDNPQGTALIQIGLSSSQSATVSGIHFQRVHHDPPNYDPIIAFQTNGTTFSRVHDCLFEDIDERAISAYSPYLLIDSNVFTCVSAWCAPIIVSWDQSGTHPMDYGGASYVFVENNTFDFSAVTGSERDGALDCKDKGRFVFRYNTLEGTRVMNHGFDSTVSCMSFEIYANDFSNDGPDYLNGYFVWLRGGTGLLYDNAMGGSAKLYGEPLGMTNYRSCSGNAQISMSRVCDGTSYGVCSSEPSGEWVDCTSDSDCSAVGAGSCNKKWCSVSRGILCQSAGDCPSGETCTSATDGTGASGYPCRDQIGRGTNQELNPLYVWNNQAYGSSVDIVVEDNGGGTCHTSEQIQADRDYCNHDPSSACGSASAFQYAPFPCPHPATNSTGSCDPSTPGRDGYAAAVADAGADAASDAPPPDGSSPDASSDAGAPPDGGTNDAGSSGHAAPASDSSGCSCSMSGRPSPLGLVIAGIGAAMLGWRRRRSNATLERVD
jgi:MYXO-CTERM domain-containing protein